MKTSKDTECSMFEEMLMWTSYRYCIGRHSYVTTMAYDLAKHYYHKLSDERRSFTAMDIRRSIKEQLQFSFNMTFDWSITEKEIKPLETFIKFLIDNNIKSDNDIKNITHIEAYKDSATSEIKYSVSKNDNIRESKYSTRLHDIEDLIPWMDMASCFDTNNYVTLTVNYNGKEEEYQAFETYRHKLVPFEENGKIKDGYCKYTDEWEKCYIGVDRYLQNPSNCGTIIPEYITKINGKNIK